MPFPLSGRLLRPLAFWPFGLALLSSFSAAQPPQPLRAQGAIALRAILPSVAQVTPATIPVSAQVTASGGTSFSFPVALRWNVDRSTRRIQIVASFANSQDALRDDFGHSIAAAQLEVSLEGQTWRPFPARSLQQLPSGVLVISENVDTLGRQGEKLYEMRIRLAEGARGVLPASYQGILQLQAVVP